MKLITPIFLILLSSMGMAQNSKFESYSMNPDSLIGEYQSPTYLEWKTSDSARVLHFIEYRRDSSIINHVRYDIISIREDNVSVIINVKSDHLMITMYFWTDHSKVLYMFKNRYVIITGDLKY